MNRPQKVFSLIIGITLAIIIYFWIVNPPGDPPCESSDPDCPTTPEATPSIEATPPDKIGAIRVTISSSDTKRDWLDDVISKFNGENHITSAGNPIFVSAEHVRSGPSKNAILDGTARPVVWSPGDASWVEQINAEWEAKNNKPINRQACRPTVNAPVGFAMWRPMAEALGWPEKPIGWDTLITLAADPEGWATYGLPEWGHFSFGHTHPAYSNTGLLSMTSFVYGALGYPESLSAAQVYEAEEAMKALEQVTSKYGTSSTALLELMRKEGPSYLHAAAVPEANVARYNVEHSDELRFPLAFVIPAGGTIWANHPYCILDNAEWVTPEQAEAAAIFRDYLLAPQQQDLAIGHYIRPADTSISLHSPLDLEHGIDPRTSPATETVLPSPDSDVSAAVQDLFSITKRKATVILALDTSGSMTKDMINSAATATNEFLDRLDKDDEVALLVFNNEVITLYEPQRVGNVVEDMKATVTTLIAGGETALYDAVCQATEMAAALKVEDEMNGESRLYGIVLLSDGDDTTSESTENQMFVNCVPTNPEIDGFKIFPIAFGEAANYGLLKKIATVTAGEICEADPEKISACYNSISAQ
jgi:Ca-activated chloride channel family protein